MADWAVLDGAITGTVFWPGRPGYDEARRPPIVRYRDVRPAAVVWCATEADVAAALSFAADAERDPDLFWALRGGGAPGVVTRLTFATVPAPDAVAFHLTWAPEHAAAVV